MISAIFAAAISQNSVPANLDWQTFTQIKTHASLKPSDLVFQSLDWRTRIFDGVVDGQKQDKPILMWLYFGDPRGHC